MARLKIFLRDLLIFSSDSGAQARLCSADPTEAFYMSALYFSHEEAQRLLLAPAHRRRDEEADPQNVTLRQALQDLQRRKMDKGELHLCTSHDLAPLIQGWFDIRKGFQEDPQFKRHLKLFLKEPEAAAAACGSALINSWFTWHPWYLPQ
ncbi:hypothetical protein L7F22_061452 [Adiantum nelumboides]|nr:hypothetical protein [Adiantum nelumboides]